MKKNLSILFLGIAIFLFTGQIFAQGFSIGVGGGLTQVVSPDNYKKDISDGGFGFSSEWNAGVTAKLSLPLLPIKPRAIILYHRLSGSGKYELLDKLEYTQSIVTAGAGLQYNFLPLPVGPDPYLFLDLLYTNFSKLKQDPESDPFADGKSISRFGLSVGIGTSVPLVPIVNLDLQLAYQMLNIAGKETGEKTTGFLTVDLFLMFGSN